MNFTIGQIFKETYPVEVAVWCNSQGNLLIKEIEPDVDGARQFQIQEYVEPELSPEELQNALQEEKNDALRESSYLMIQDMFASLSPEEQQAITSYRSELIKYDPATSNTSQAQGIMLLDVGLTEEMKEPLKFPKIPSILAKYFK